MSEPPDCRHWRPDPAASVVIGGVCAAGHYDRPSFGVCAACKHFDNGRAMPLVEPRPAPTVTQVAAFAMAAVKGRYVPEPVTVERAGICEACEHARRDPAAGPWCRLCGCKVNERTRVDNLAAYEESIAPLDPSKPLPLPRRVRYGCKHPQREQGRGWPLRGVLSLKVIQ